MEGGGRMATRPSPHAREREREKKRERENDDLDDLFLLALRFSFYSTYVGVIVCVTVYRVVLFKRSSLGLTTCYRLICTRRCRPINKEDVDFDLLSWKEIRRRRRRTNRL